MNYTKVIVPPQGGVDIIFKHKGIFSITYNKKINFDMYIINITDLRLKSAVSLRIAYELANV